MSDGGEGLLDVLGGPNRTSRVTGPLGAPVEAVVADRPAHGRHRDGAGPAGWRSPAGPRATTRCRRRRSAPASSSTAPSRRVPGGSSSASAARRRRTAGSAPSRRCAAPARLRTVELEVACDVRTRFVDAAAVFAPQKGASPAQVGLLTARLERLAQRYDDEYGIDVARPRRRRRRRWPGRRAGGARWTAGARVRPRGRARRARRAARRGRRRRHRRGLPRRPEPRRQGRRRASASWRPSPAGRVVVIVGDVDAEVAAELTARDRRRGDLAGRALRRRAGPFSEPRWCIEHAAADALRRDARISPRRPSSVDADRGRRCRTTSTGGRRRGGSQLGERLVGGVGADHHAARSTCRGPCRSAAGRASPRSCSPPRSGPPTGDRLGGRCHRRRSRRRTWRGRRRPCCCRARPSCSRRPAAPAVMRRLMPPIRRWRWRPTTVAPLH